LIILIKNKYNDMNIKIEKIDYLNKSQAHDLTFLLNEYASDKMGGGTPLGQNVLDNLAAELSERPHAISIICYVDNKPAGLINCFEAFSTFYCKPLINIHDVMVLQEFRGLGLSHKMLAEVEKIALSKGCCKLTLEVLSQNEVAKSSYKKYGFDDYSLDAETGHALFWQKILN